MIKIVRISVLFSVLFLTAALGYAGETDTLKNYMERIAAKMEKSAPRRPFQLAAMNESLMLTWQAVQAYRQNVDSGMAGTDAMLPDSLSPAGLPLGRVQRTVPKEVAPEVKALLDQAAARYPQNAFVDLWEAQIAADEEHRAQANEKLIAFLKSSAHYTAFEKELLSAEEFEGLRTAVRTLLKSRGVMVSDREAPPSVFKQFGSLSVREKTDRVVVSVFAVVLFLGAIGLFFAYWNGVSFLKGLPWVCFRIYLCVGVASALWVVDWTSGLPWGLSRFKVVPWFLAGAVCYFMAREIFRFGWERYGPVQKGFARCRHCGHIFPELMLECPECHRKK
ncbi:MAG: hypothetical protein PHN49_06525 [Candidatus Omnitrophica bacterium]|nr:hypothetical protein [Candidatus Omnitrophota bacterium]